MFFRVLCIPLFLGCSAVAFVLPTPKEKNYATRTPFRTVDASRVMARTISLRKSLFDDDDDDQNNDERSTSSSSSSSSNTNEPASRKFTGQDYFTAGATGGVASNNLRNDGGGDGDAPIMSPRDQMRQREDNLVNRATSPSAFLFQAASIVVLLGLVIYVGATGQLGMNNDYYEDDYFNYDPETVMVVPPESTNMPESKEESVWL